MDNLTNNPLITEAKEVVSKQNLGDQLNALMKRSRQRSAKYTRLGWAMMLGGIVVLIAGCSIPLSGVGGSAAVAAFFLGPTMGIILIPVGRHIWNKGERVKQFSQPEAAIIYIAALMARDSLLKEHANEWYCPKCSTWNANGVDPCAKCGTAYDPVLVKYERDKALNQLNAVISLLD